MSKLSLIVVGEMNTDITISGLPYFPKSGQLVNGKRADFGPGGKSRNIASMASSLMSPGSVAMVSKTIKDKYGLWGIPLNALRETGVNTDYVKVIENDAMEDLPGLAVILVDDDGHNEIIGAPGITRFLNVDDINDAQGLFNEVAENNGFVSFIGNCPYAVASHIAKMANRLGIRVLFDPGGADDLLRVGELLDKNIYLFKPNECEAEAITGIKIRTMADGRKAAAKIMDRGVTNVLITLGSQGAYLFDGTIEKYIPAPKLNANASAVRDETGCGDQVMASLSSFLCKGADIETASDLAIECGTLQYYKKGIQPITLDELNIK